MLAFTRHDVRELNKEAREAYRHEGRLSGPDVEVVTSDGDKQFAHGDRLYFIKNDLRLGVLNGSLGTVESIAKHLNGNGHRFRVRLDGGGDVTFDTAEFDKFTHGYAATIHKAQGATVDRVHVLASEFMDRHAAYVAMSRHREQVDLHYAEPEFRDFEGLVRTLSRDRRKDTTLDYVKRAADRGEESTLLARLRQLPITAADRLREVANSYKSKEARKQFLEKEQALLSASRLRRALEPEKHKKKERAPGLSF